MRIAESVQKVMIVEETRGIQCNKCGTVFQPYDEKIKEFNAPLGNSNDVRCDLCDDCLLEIIRTFKVVPTGFMSETGYTSSFETDKELHQNLFEEWKLTNEWNCEDENPYKEFYEQPNEVLGTIDPFWESGLHIVK